ncbi:hypothetical protein QBC46DRAFT_437116, partial [Diplogelasinospora grovesii]
RVRKIDRPTIEALEHTAPGACEGDSKALYNKLRSGEIFAAFSERERQVTWRRVLAASVDCLIPSLSTLFEDVKYIEGPLEALKRLVPPYRKDTISSELLGAYKDINQESDQAELNMRQAWMCAMRNSTDIPPPRRKKENVRRANPAFKESARALYEFASVLFRLGFNTDEIRDATQPSP